MKSFRDINGTTWDVAGSLGMFERIKTQTGVDLLDLPTTQKSLSQLGDPYTLGHVLYQFCASQAEARGVSPERFYDLFNADVLHEASTAILEEVVFFCRSNVKPALMMALEKAKAAEERMAAIVRDRMGEIGQQMDEALTSTNFATSSQESSASTQASGRSGGSSGQPRRRRKSVGATPAR